MTYTKENLPKVGDVILIGGKRATVSKVGGAWIEAALQDNYIVELHDRIWPGMEYERPRKELSVAERWTAIAGGKTIESPLGMQAGIMFSEYWGLRTLFFRFPDRRDELADDGWLVAVDAPGNQWYLVEDA